MDLFYRSLNVVIHDFSKNKGVFCFIPEPVWDDIQENATTETYIKHFGPSWKAIINATADNFNNLTDTVSLYPDDQLSLYDMFKDDPAIFMPSTVSPNVWFVRCGVLLTDTLVQMRLKLYSVTGWDIFCQHMFFVNEYKDGFKSDVLLVYENGNLFYANPFEEPVNKDLKGTKHDQNVAPYFNTVYVLLAQDVPPSKHGVFKTLFPQFPIEYLENMGQNYQFNIRTSAFPYMPTELRAINQSQVNHIWANMNESDNVNVNLTNQVSNVIFAYQINAEDKQTNIRYIYNELSSKLRFSECRITNWGVDLRYERGTKEPKTNVLESKTKKLAMNPKENYYFCNHSYEDVIVIAYFGANGRVVITIKFIHKDVEYATVVERAKNVCTKVFGQFVNSTKICEENMVTVSIVFVWVDSIENGKYYLVKETVSREQKHNTFSVVGIMKKNIEVSLQNLHMPPKSLPQSNDFENWINGIELTNSGNSCYSNVTLKIALVYTKIYVKSGKINPNQIKFVIRVIKTISNMCLKTFHENANVVVQHQTIDEDLKRNSKILRQFDPERFDHQNNNNGRNQSNLFAQKCQSTDQPVPKTQKEYDNMSDQERILVIKLTNMTTGELLFLMCSIEKPVLNFMVTFTNPIIITEDGEHRYICLGCCRKSVPKNAERVKRRETCIKHGTYPVADLSEGHNSGHILKPRVNNCANRLLELPPTVGHIITSPRIYMFGPKSAHDSSQRYFNAVYSALNKTELEFIVEINDYFDTNPEEFQAFLILSTLIWSNNHRTLFSVTEFPTNLKRLANNKTFLEHIINSLVSIVYDFRVFLFKNGAHLPYGFFTNTTGKPRRYIILVDFEGVLFPMVRLITKTYTKHRVGLDFVFDDNSKVLSEITTHINESNEGLNATFDEYIKRLSAKCDINFYYAKETILIYGVNVTYGKETFYLPIPQTSQVLPNTKEEDPIDYPSLKLVSDLVEEMDYEINKYLTYEDFVFGFTINIENLIILIKEKTLMSSTITSPEYTTELYFDLRESFQYNNLGVQRPNVQNEECYKIETGKMISYSLYVLLAMSLILVNVETKSAARLELERLSTKRDFVNLAAKSPLVDRHTYEQLLTLVKHGSDPLQFLLFCDMAYLQKKYSGPELETLIKNHMDLYTHIAATEDAFKENLLQPLPIPTKVTLSKFMKTNYPCILTEHLKSSIVQGLITPALKNILEKNPIFLMSSKMTNVEFNAFSD